MTTKVAKMLPNNLYVESPVKKQALIVKNQKLTKDLIHTLHSYM